MKRFVIGSLLEHKESGQKALLEYSYAAAFGGNDYNDLSVIWLDENGKLEYSSAWHSKRSFNIIESDIKTNMKKIRKFNKGDAAPICMNPDIAEKLGYGSIHTYASALAGKKKGDIKL